jgi:hypothetical protein
MQDSPEMRRQRVNVLDSVTKRGKRKDAVINNPSLFVPGMKVDFMRRNEAPDNGFHVIGTATIEDVNTGDKALKFDALPVGVRVDDLITLHSSY